MASIKEILERLDPSKTASTNVDNQPAGASVNTDPIKIAQEAGVKDANELFKVASVMGDEIGNRAGARALEMITESLGYNPEVLKTASLQDVIVDCFMKIAEQVTGNTAAAGVAATNAETLQVTESAAHHANLAAQSAHSAVQSLEQGDEHTATQMFATAAGAIQRAQEMAARVNVPELHQHVAECAELVNQAASQAGGAAGV